MVGRKLALPPSTVIDAVLHFKDKVISINDEGNKSKLAIILVLFYFNKY